MEAPVASAWKRQKKLLNKMKNPLITIRGFLTLKGLQKIIFNVGQYNILFINGPNG